MGPVAAAALPIMHTQRLSLRTAVLAALALVGFGALAEVPANAEIYQQRAADGSIVLTDRPSANAVTERTWQMKREDAGATQRAADVRREADIVSERVQRQIEAQERRAADADLMRMRLARLDQSTDSDDGSDDGYGYATAVPLFRPYAARHHTMFDSKPTGPRRAVQGAAASRSRGGTLALQR